MVGTKYELFPDCPRFYHTARHGFGFRTPPPLPTIAREALINNQCAAEYRQFAAANPTNRDCLARKYLCLRHMKTTPPPNLTLRNFNLHLDQMIELKYPIGNLATAIGEALAVIHRLANVDAYDIEFVLGSETDSRYKHNVLSTLKLSSGQVVAMPMYTDIEHLLAVKSERHATRLWVFYFNLCHIWYQDTGINHPESLITHLVEAFSEDDPYYPLPLMENALEHGLWDMFSNSHIRKASEALQARDPRLSCLPQKFIDGCVQREMESLRKEIGHGHREMNQ